MNNDELLHLNQQGFIPGPEETEAEYSARVAYCLNLVDRLKDGVGTPWADTKPPVRMEPLFLEAADVTRPLFDITPSWVPILFSNHKLAFWHGGCAWIFQMDEQIPLGALFQLRENFARSKVYLKLYQRKELIAHESAHIARMMFQEPKFEELLAYRTASSRFRRWFGPICTTSKETLLFMTSLFLSVTAATVGDLFLPLAIWGTLVLLPLLLFTAALLRLWKRHSAFQRCWQALFAYLKDSTKTNAVILRLRDQEIESFGKMSPEQIYAYAHKEAAVSLRWRSIFAAYFG